MSGADRSYRLAFPSDRLFERAMRILDDAGTRYGRPFDWTMGGGTVLALRHGHRSSKDIDIFVPDPQYLNYLTPRLSDVAAEGLPDYEEAAGFVKLRYAEGEVDFVVGTLLTRPGAELAHLGTRPVRLETDIEIVAKKLHYRGARLAARDVFDLAMVLEADPGSAAVLRDWAASHREAIAQSLARWRGDAVFARAFAAIDARAFAVSVDQALARCARLVD